MIKVWIIQVVFYDGMKSISPLGFTSLERAIDWVVNERRAVRTGEPLCFVAQEGQKQTKYLITDIDIAE